MSLEETASLLQLKILRNTDRHIAGKNQPSSTNDREIAEVKWMDDSLTRLTELRVINKQQDSSYTSATLLQVIKNQIGPN